MSDSVVIVGAGGHGKVIADIVIKSGDVVKGFLDDKAIHENQFVGFPILGTIREYKNFKDSKFVIGIGDSKIREQLAGELEGVTWYTAIHPSAVLPDIKAEIGEGTVIMANSIINPSTKIGDHCIINSAAVIEHDNVIEDFSHISVGARLGGTVHIGKRCWIGIGAIVSNNLSICDDSMIGAGGVVIHNIEKAGTYVGVPAMEVNRGENET